MKKFKNFIGLFLIGIMVFALSACGSKSYKQTIINAVEKSKNINSCAYKMNIDFKSDEVKQKDAPMPSLNNVSVKVNGKSIKEKDNKSKFQGNMKFNAPGINFAMDMIGQASSDKDKSKFEMFMGIPEFMKAQAAPMFENIDYLYISSDTFDKLEKQLKKAGELPLKKGVNPSNINGLDTQKELLKSLKDYIDKNGDKVIKSKGKQEVEINNKKENIEIYDLKFDNAQIKKVLKDIMTSGNKDLDAKEVDKSIDEILKTFGKDGLKITIGIKDGYIVYEKFNIKAKEKDAKVEADAVVSIFDINKKMEIKVPKKEEVKSIDLMELIGIFLSQGMQ